MSIDILFNSKKRLSELNDSGVENKKIMSADEGVKQQHSDQVVQTHQSQQVKPKKICCACPVTKKARDECIILNGEAGCRKFIEEHLKCLEAEGFDVSSLRSKEDAK